MNEVALRIRKLCARRGAEPVLADVDLDVAAGEVHVLTGPNGGGKSTLIACVLGVLPFRGEVLLGEGVEGRVGYVPQGFIRSPALALTVREFLSLTLQRRPIWLGTSPARGRVEDALADLDAGELADKSLGALSGGELQRVLLAQALLREPRLLLLDEPVRGLDPTGRARLASRLADLAGDGVAILLVSHELGWCRGLASQVTLLDGGVTDRGEPDAVLRRYLGAS